MLGNIKGLRTFQLSYVGQSPLWGICTVDQGCNEVSSSAGATCSMPVDVLRLHHHC